MNLSSGFIVGLIFIFLGIASLFGANVWNLIWPLLLIFIGLKIIYRNPKKNQKDDSYDFDFKPSISHENSFDYSIIMNGLNEKIISKNFEGGEINLIMSGGRIDLLGCQIKEGKTVTIKLNSIMGGVKIIVPGDWQVSVRLSQIAGGFKNDTKSISKPKAKLTIEGSLIFAGGVITNEQ